MSAPPSADEGQVTILLFDQSVNGYICVILRLPARLFGGIMPIITKVGNAVLANYQLYELETRIATLAKALEAILKQRKPDPWILVALTTDMAEKLWLLRVAEWQLPRNYAQLFVEARKKLQTIKTQDPKLIEAIKNALDALI